MKKIFYIAAILSVVFLVESCHGDYRASAIGPKNQIIVIMDSTQWHSKTANAIRTVYGRSIKTIPRWQALYDLKFRDFKTDSQLNQLKKYKNIIIAAPISDSSNTATYIRALLSDSVRHAVEQGKYFAFPLKNQWYRNQSAVILTSTSDSVLAQKILNAKNTLPKQFLKRTLQRYKQQIYHLGEKTAIEDSLWKEHGWKIRVEHDWYVHIDTSITQKNGAHTGFLTMRRNLSQNRRWFWAWWTDSPPPQDSLTPKWINQTRDSLMKKYIRGTRDSSYVTTDYKHFPVKTDTVTLDDGHTAYETRGVWHMTHGAMGGPFVNMAIYDKYTGRLFLLEFGQFAPKYRKRRFVREFQAMLLTFQSDSTWNQKKKTSNTAK
ncbi:MAG TPA: DUF4837 family protein [Balneolaceae bacterium]|nr:DUF4837 family protein [Balneolaceae bacterium]